MTAVRSKDFSPLPESSRKVQWITTNLGLTRQVLNFP